MLTAERTDTAGQTEEVEGKRSLVDGFRDPRPPRTTGRRRLLAVLLVVVVVVAGLAVPTVLGYFPSVYQPPVPEDVAFVVDGQDTTVQSYDDQLHTLAALTGIQAPADPAGADQFRRAVAKTLMISTVMDQAESEMNIVIPDTKVRDTVNQQIAQQFGAGPDGYQRFVQSLGQVGTSEGEVLAMLKRNLAATQLIQQVTAGVPRPSDDQLPAEFPKYRDRLGQPEARQLSNIVVADPQTANDVLNRLKAGQPFADVARQSSIDTSTKDQGGSLGELTRDQLQQGYANAAFAAPPGGLFGPVQTTQGWNVGQVVRVRQAVPADYGRVIEQLRSVVWANRKAEVWSTWLRGRIDSDHVRFADAYRPDDPTGLPAVGQQ